MSEVAAGLRAAYHRRCNEEGAPLETFLDEARGEWTPEELVVLVDEVERDVLENMGLMVEAHPEMEAAAEGRAAQVRQRMEAARERVRE